MIKELMVFDKGKYVCTVEEDITFEDGSMVQLASAILDEGLISVRIIDILYVRDMDYGIIIPMHVAHEMNTKIDALTRMNGADIDGDMIDGVYHNISQEQYDEKKEFLEAVAVGRKTGCDLDGDVINGKYHHIINEAKLFGVSMYYIINGIEAPDVKDPDKGLEDYIKNDIEITEKLAEEFKKPASYFDGDKDYNRNIFNQTYRNKRRNY
ncbi:MAG: hypothetical protein WCS56_00330 [Bacilli bacterium]